MNRQSLVFAAMTLAATLLAPTAQAQDTKAAEPRPAATQKNPSPQAAKPATSTVKKAVVPAGAELTATQPSQAATETSKSKSGYRGSDCQHSKDIDA